MISVADAAVGMAPKVTSSAARAVRPRSAALRTPRKAAAMAHLHLSPLKADGPVRVRFGTMAALITAAPAWAGLWRFFVQGRPPMAQ